MTYPLVAIGNLCQPTEHRDPRTRPEEFFDYVDISSIDRRSKLIISTQRLEGADAPSRARKVVRDGDVIVSTVRPNLTAVALVPHELDDQIASTGFCVLRPDAPLADSRYLFYWTTTTSFILQLTSRMQGANYPAVSDSMVKEALIPLPGLTEQRRIAAILSQADALRRARARADAGAERILLALYSKTFGDAVSDQAKWPRSTLGNVVEDLRYGTSVRCTSEPAGWPVLRIPNVLGGELDLTDLKYASLPAEEVERLQLQSGDLLFVRTNGNPDYVGRCSVFDLAQPHLFASYLIRARPRADYVDPWFLWGYLSTPAGRRAILPFIRTTAGQSNIAATGLEQIPLPLPPLDLQRGFREQVQRVRRLRAAMARSTEAITATFQAFLQRAFSGELTAGWRQAHLEGLLQEMGAQAAALAARDPSRQLSLADAAVGT